MKVPDIQFFGFERPNNFLVEAFPNHSVQYINNEADLPCIFITLRGEVDLYEIRLHIYHPSNNALVGGGPPTGKIHLDFVAQKIKIDFDNQQGSFESVHYIDKIDFDNKEFIKGLASAIGQVPPIRRTLPESEFNKKYKGWFKNLLEESGVSGYLSKSNS